MLMKWVQKLRKLFRGQGDLEIVSEERLLKEEFDRLDAEEPGWDREGRIVGACAWLERGGPREMVVRVYGEELVVEAERLKKERESSS